MDKIKKEYTNDSTKVVLSLLMTESKLTDLWRLDALRILDAVDKGSRLELEGAVKEYFNKHIEIYNEVGYQVSLSGNISHRHLPRAREIAERRLKNCVDT